MSNRVLLEPTYKAIVSTLKASTRLGYVKNDDIWDVPKENKPPENYGICLFPLSVSNLPRTESDSLVNVAYAIGIICAVKIANDVETQLYGKTSKPGLFDLVSDIYFTIKDSPNFGVNSSGSSIAMSKSSTSYILSSSVRYLTVSVDNKTPSGYDQIDCGVSTLTGTQIASNIQTSLRALAISTSIGSDDPYAEVTCTYDNDEKQFTITSPSDGGRSSVVVTAGATNNTSSILGFDKPKETRGGNVVVSRINVTYPVTEEERIPIARATLELYIEEEVYFD